MRATVASESGRSDGRNEDWAGVSERVAVVLDGLSEAPETDCQHGTPWYVHQLGGRLLALAGDPRRTLQAALAEAILEVAALHRHSCDLGHPGSPCSTVAMVRQIGDGFDYLVLSDSILIIDVKGAPPVVVQDKSVEDFAGDLKAAAAAAAGSEDRSALHALIHAQQQIRNQPDGYWVAQVDPRAAEHAKTGRVAGARGAALLSDGAALLVTDFKIMDWPRLLTLAYDRGPAEIIAMTRELEDRDPDGTVWPRYKSRDDATAVVCIVSPPSPTVR